MPTNSQARTRARLSAVSALLALAIASPTSGHDLSINLDADHAFAGDPLAGLSTGAGLLPGFAPDQPTAMGSTTKIMTLIVALAAVKAGVVDYGDRVTIGFDVIYQPANSSLMTDVDGVPLEIGERVRFEDLLFGLIIQSGNDAATAIAGHVADGYLGELGSVAAFVGFMNSKAGDLGLGSTFFRNPAGIDAPLHMTTARELARIWEHGMTDPEFRRFVRPQTWNAETTFLSNNVIKSYEMVKSDGYPGIEGHKNGRTSNCSGADKTDQCFVGSARRIGRRIIIAGMQSDGVIGDKTGDPADVWDFGFHRLFHPDARGASPLGDFATRLSLTCPAAGRTITASLPSIGRPVLTSWTTDVSGKTSSISGKTTAPLGALAPTTGSQGRDIDSIAMSSSRVVTVTRVDTNVELRLWAIPASGAPTTVGGALGGGRVTGLARSIDLVRLSATVFATVARTPDDGIAIRTYRVTATGLTALKSLVQPAGPNGILEIDVASAPGQQGLRFVTVAARSTDLLIQAWEVAGFTGSITGVSSRNYPLAGSGLSIVPAPVEAMPDEVIPDKFYAIAFRRTTGTFAMIYARVGATGALGPSAFGASAASITDVELAPFGASGILSLTRSANGTLTPIVWETYRDPSLSRNPGGTPTALRISDHGTSISGAEPEVCASPTTKAEGDFISGLREGFGSIVRLRGWRVGARP